MVPGRFPEAGANTATQGRDEQGRAGAKAVDTRRKRIKKARRTGSTQEQQQTATATATATATTTTTTTHTHMSHACARAHRGETGRREKEGTCTHKHTHKKPACLTTTTRLGY